MQSSFTVWGWCCLDPYSDPVLSLCFAGAFQSEMKDVKYDKDQLTNKCHEFEAVSITVREMSHFLLCDLTCV